MQTIQIAAPTSGHASHVDDEVLLDSKQMRASVGEKSDMCIWRWQRDPRVQFPKPDVVINGRRYWYAGTIRRWKAERMSAQGASVPAGV